MRAFSRCGCVSTAAMALLSANALSQTISITPNWLPAASGTDPIEITFSTLTPDLYELLNEGTVTVRWNSQFLPTQNTAYSTLEFTVPPELRTPGPTEFVLWNSAAQQPLPYSGWISIVIPAPADVFEADPTSNRVVAAVSADGSGSGMGGQIEVYELSTGILKQSIVIPASQRVLAFTPDTAYAWMAVNEGQGQLARLNLSSGQIDQQIQITDGTPPYTLSAQVYRQNPSVLMVSIRSSNFSFSGTRAYTDGHALPNAAPAGALLPFGWDNQGRFITRSGQACQLDASVGFISCDASLFSKLSSPIVFLYPVIVWKNKIFEYSGAFDLATGAALFSTGSDSGYGRVNYLPESNRVVFTDVGRFLIADGDSLEPWADLGSDLVGFINGPQRLWAPDWILMQTYAPISSTGGSAKGILVGHLPQLAPAPSITSQSIVNAATGQTGPLAPGEIISIYGQNMGPTEASGPVPESGLKLATDVESTEVLFDGVAGAILYAGTSQINAVVPETLQGSDSVEVQVVRYGIPSARVLMQVAAVSPGFFSYPVQGQAYAAALTANYAVQGPNTPLERGNLALFYATGLGMAAGETADSIAARAAEVPTRPSVTIGGQPAQVLYAGVSPGETVGLTQLNVIVPADAPTGSAVEAVITLGGQSQGNVWVAVQ